MDRDILIRTHTHTHTHIHTQAHMHTHACTHTHICMHVHTWTSIHPSTQPSYSTKVRSQTLASPDFCLQSILFCVVSFQLRHQKSLATSSFTQVLPLKPVSPHWSIVSAFLGIWSRGGLCTSPAQLQSLEFIAIHYVKNFILSIKFFITYNTPHTTLSHQSKYLS